jgi:hypothetical protein
MIALQEWKRDADASMLHGHGTRPTQPMTGGGFRLINLALFSAAAIIHLFTPSIEACDVSFS